MDRARTYQWMAPADLSDLPMPEANRAILRSLRWRLP